VVRPKRRKPAFSTFFCRAGCACDAAPWRFARSDRQAPHLEKVEAATAEFHTERIDVLRDNERHGMLDSPDWGAFYLWKDDELMAENAARGPETSAHSWRASAHPREKPLAPDPVFATAARRPYATAVRPGPRGARCA
jgi:hypothetical protein